MIECLALDIEVSPQTPSVFLSCIILDQGEYDSIERRKDLRRYQAIQRHRLDHSIGINHEQILVEGWVNADNVLDLVVNLKFQRIHRRAEVDLRSVMNTCRHSSEESANLVQEVHEGHL